MSRKHRVLIANRGEIAVRIMRACVKLGLEFVAVYTAEDAYSGHCDTARKLGGEGCLYRISSYQDANEIFAVADTADASAVHPGYGFFAEDFRFARRVANRTRKMVFIGPSWEVIRELGDKINTKRLARSLGVPTVPGSDKPVRDEMEALEIANNLFAFQLEQGIKTPVILVKASAGGGGMGIEEVHDPDTFRSVFRRIRNYAKRQFRDDGVLIEQRITDFNHLEVQIMGDRDGGRIVHFGTRNCSVQSSGHQKRIEVAPGFVPGELAYAFDARKLLNDITAYSMTMAREVHYNNAGTWEWIVSPLGHPFLMEVNTRIQVENGVSAVISQLPGRQEVDLIEEQIRLALGGRMDYDVKDINFAGVGIEYRIIAEEPANRFAPWVGEITAFSWPQEPWLKMFTHVPADRAYDIPTEYDPNLALAIVWGENLAQAKERGRSLLDRIVLTGRTSKGRSMQTNIAFLREKTEHILEF